MIDVIRPAEAPPSLARRLTYDDDDVRRALHAVFLRKCYLCETPVMVGTFEVDHRRPKGEERFEHLTHEWTNLFPICREFACNQRRKRRYPDGGLLDPGEGVETRVVQKISGAVSTALRKSGSVELVFQARDPADLPAANTAAELDRLHNGTDSTAQAAAEALRNAIRDHISAVSMEVFSYLQLLAAPAAETTSVAQQRQRVTTLLSRRAPYAMLARSLFSSLEAIRALFD
jgi:hypothetical protein